jgi:hypothetical protein
MGLPVTPADDTSDIQWYLDRDATVIPTELVIPLLERLRLLEAEHEYLVTGEDS